MQAPGTIDAVATASPDACLPAIEAERGIHDVAGEIAVLWKAMQVHGSTDPTMGDDAPGPLDAEGPRRSGLALLTDKALGVEPQPTGGFNPRKRERIKTDLKDRSKKLAALKAGYLPQLADLSKRLNEIRDARIQRARERRLRWTEQHPTASPDSVPDLGDTFQDAEQPRANVAAVRQKWESLRDSYLEEAAQHLSKLATCPASEIFTTLRNQPRNGS
jgi:hypothetical protein